MPTIKNVYLAAPFFSPEESRVINQVEDIFARQAASVRYRLFSPRRDGGACDARIESERKRVFHLNAASIDKASLVLGWMERIPEPGRFREPMEDAPTVARLPDLGTVWQLGYAYSQGIPIYLFGRSREMRLPVMVSECAEGVIYGISRLEYLVTQVALRSWKTEIAGMNREDERLQKEYSEANESTQR